ncbi:hypothetical protein [Streptomyces sp. PSKA30]|uniref:hypothetical protein n=1 Tax=Streptomyces sp. PSKA30 TaxID=2874597 RepID=UPI001CD0668F|nr:hypothetical protein [Streptomyces sp. PSKA30]MBZ9644088.1 hypothetical protein [Streptomyces sp. PSKA30]
MLVGATLAGHGPLLALGLFLRHSSYEVDVLGLGEDDQLTAEVLDPPRAADPVVVSASVAPVGPGEATSRTDR